MCKVESITAQAVRLCPVAAMTGLVFTPYPLFTKKDGRGDHTPADKRAAAERKRWQKNRATREGKKGAFL